VPCGTLLDSVSCRKALLNADRLDLQAADRRALDEAVFDVLGLTAGEREAVYEAVVNLVRAAGEGTERVICTTMLRARHAVP
jgi:gamma-glutamyl phosphate reductase